MSFRYYGRASENSERGAAVWPMVECELLEQYGNPI